MKILKNNYNKKENVHMQVKEKMKIVCDQCGSELEITEDDTYIGWLGIAFVDCPCCGKEVMTDFPGITLTKDNLIFPKHFHRCSKDTGAVEVENDWIVSEISRAIDYLRIHKNEFAVELGSGDCTIHVYRYSDDSEYHIVVSRDYYETDIPFEGEDC